MYIFIFVIFYRFIFPCFLTGISRHISAYLAGRRTSNLCTAASQDPKFVISMSKAVDHPDRRGKKGVLQLDQKHIWNPHIPKACSVFSCWTGILDWWFLHLDMYFSTCLQHSFPQHCGPSSDSVLSHFQLTWGPVALSPSLWKVMRNLHHQRCFGVWTKDEVVFYSFGGPPSQ